MVNVKTPVKKPRIKVVHIGQDYGTVEVTIDGETTEYETSKGLAEALKIFLRHTQ